ncbi:MAG: PKD domain-containing protein [Euryarchaeota archaeon]|nr:PKD domain-containing protein [Euryarchaeota archaeon]
MQEKVMKRTASFVLISLLLASIFAGAGVGEVEDGAEEETAPINIINAGLPATSFLNTQTPFLFMPNDNSLSSEIGDISHDKTVFLFSTSSTTVTLTAVADATVKSWQPDSNFGSDSVLSLSYSEIDVAREAVTLLRFDLASALPEGAIIDSASLELFLVDGFGADPAGVAAYFVTSNWDESSVTWNSFPTAEPIGVISQVDKSPGSYKSWDISSFAQVWQSGSNNGVYLRGPVTYYERTFESREHAESVPQLVVTYHLPTYMLSGRVYTGDVGDESTPLSGVTVELYCSNNARDPGTLIASTTTDYEGWYGLLVSGVCEFYNILETDSAGYTSVGATSVDGTVVTSNWIQYEYPLDEKTLTGNRFWDRHVNLPPTADPNGPYAGTEGVSVAFDGSGSSDPDGSIVSYTWYFGDGGTGTGMIPPTHTYVQDGTYTVTLTVTDNDGATGTSTTTAAIADTGPVADFSGAPRSGPEPLTVDFKDASASYDGIDSREWDFDDDGTVDSTARNPTYVYAEYGTYTITLKVYEADGDSDTETKTDYIIVTKPDLNITDIWNEEGRICYRIENVGDGVAPGGHCTALSVDGVYRMEDCVEEDIAPGAGMERCFEYDWECSPPEDVVVVCADHRDAVEERDEENNCVERVVGCPPAEKPDLVVTDLWNDEGRICYQIRNIGDGVAPEGHCTALIVDNEYRVCDLVDQELEPGKRLRGCFDYDWECTSPEDLVVVVADHEEGVAEDNETNNMREEIWRCDVIPPQIVHGPIVQEVTQESAVIVWETDEDSDSVVKYGKASERYDLEEGDSAVVIEHSITLSRLEPSTTYNFVAQSTDASGNTVKSNEVTLETLPVPDDIDPTVSIVDPGVCQGIVTIEAEAEDDIGVEKVEFFIADELVFTDYSPPYELTLDTDKYENGEYILKAKTTDLFGRFFIDERIIGLLNAIDVTVPSVNIYHPLGGATVSGDQRILVSIEDDTGVNTVEFFIHGKQIACYNYPTTPNKIEFDVSNPFWWDTRFWENKYYTVAVRATDEDGKTSVDTVNVKVSNPEPPLRPKLVVTKHNVTRHKNYFGIDLWVQNEGGARAENIEIQDSLRAFQPISEKVGSVDYKADFNPSTWEGSCIITDTLDLDPGHSRYYTFKAVPVLIHPNPPKPSIGDSIKLTYEGVYGATYSETPVSFAIKETTLNYPNVPIATAYNDALKEADYLIMTNRPWLILRNLFQLDDVNTLFSDMAHLATLRNGVLGYFSSPYVSRDTIRDLIKPGGDWAKKLNPKFSKPLEGYLLIVGETEIVPAWTELGFIHGWSVRMSDHPYADTGGTPAPDLIVGRIIGDDAADLTKPIQASIGVFEGSTGYAFDRKKALVVSGPGGGVGSFVNSTEDVAVTLQNQKFSVEKLHMKDYFAVSSFARDYEQHDEFAVGNVLGGANDEIVIGDASANKIAIYNMSGTLIYEFSRTFDSGDGLAVGDVMGYGKDQIIHADNSQDYIYITEIQETSPGIFSAVVVGSFDASFDKTDDLALGDVMGDAREEVVISDISLNKIFIRRMDLGKWSSFDYELEEHDLLAAGDFMDIVPGDTKDEIIIADRSAKEIVVCGASGPPCRSLKFKDVLGEGSALAVGNVHYWGKDEIILAPAEHSHHIRTYWWKASDDKLRETGPITFEFDNFDGLAAGGNHEVFVADRDGVIRTFDCVNFAARVHSALPGLTQNVDVIYWHGHGNSGEWDGGIDSATVRTINFNNHNPFVMTASCSTGNYEHGSIAESFLASGAAAYIGSTEDTIWTSRETAEYFFANWTADESIGEVFTDMEKSVWGKGSYWDLYVWQHNLYGDPKYGRVSSTTTIKVSSLAESESPTPLSSLQVKVPDYIVATLDGLDYVEIPGGYRWYEQGRPWVPFYTASIDYPIGYKVQDVTLVETSGLVTDTNLSIPMTPLNITPSTYVPVPYSGTLEGWFPGEDYRWEILENPDGSATLVILMYPFHYNPLTTDVRFYANYSFDINYTVSPVAITTLTTDRDEYEQSDTVMADIGLNNSDEPQDVIFSATVKRYGSDEVVGGLLLRTLKEFTGLASFSPRWDSDGFEPGYYFVEVTLKDTSSKVLDRKTEMFRLGISSGEIASFTATPECFDIGDEIGIEMAFENNGTVNITGTAVIRVLNSTGHATEEFRHNITNLTPSESISFSDTWDTSEAVAGSSYTIVGYVLYDSRSTDPATVTVRNMIMGDLNRDGEITPTDAAITLEMAARGEYDPAADVDCDGQVTSLDAMMIAQAAAGNIELQGCELK